MREKIIKKIKKREEKDLDLPHFVHKKIKLGISEFVYNKKVLWKYFGILVLPTTKSKLCLKKVYFNYFILKNHATD